MSKTFQDLKAFFEGHALAQAAASSIRNGKEIALIVIYPNDTQEPLTFAKESSKNVIREGMPQSADLSFFIPEAPAQELVTHKFETVGQVGLHIFEKMLSNDPNQKIRVKIHAGVLSLVMGGYLGVLTAGGTEVAKFLATKGLGNLGKLKDAISKMKG